MLFLLCVAGLAFALWNRTSIDRLERSVAELRAQLALAGHGAAAAAAETAPPAPAAAEPQARSNFEIEEPPPLETKVAAAVDTPALAPASPLFDIDPEAARPADPEPQRPTEPGGTETIADLERQFGARLPVWIGGVALALAGFFLVRYTIDIGLLTEAVRVSLGSAFGFALLGGGHLARRSFALANGARIAQALSGAGIAVLYASLLVAASLYHLISPLAGFAGMAAVTAGAVALSLRHGAPIAVLGLVGGFLTPAMTAADEPNIPLLFGYLYCLFAGLLAVIRKQGWWHLAIPVVLAAFVWVPVATSGEFVPRDSFWLLLYVMAIGATVVLAAESSEGEGSATSALRPLAMLRYVALSGVTLLGGFVSGVGGFGPVDWSLFGVLSTGGIVLAAVRPRQYSFVPVAALAMTGLMFVAWSAMSPAPAAYAVTLLIFALLYGVSGYALMWRSGSKLMWGGIAAAAAMGSYLQGYDALQSAVIRNAANIPVWGGVATLLSLVCGLTVLRILRGIANDDPHRESLLAIFTATGAALFTIGLAIELERPWLYVAVSAELLAVAWLAIKMEIPALKPIGVALLALFGVLIAPELLLVLHGALTSIGLPDRPGGVPVSVGGLSVLRLGACVPFLAGTVVLLLKKADSDFVRAVETAAALLFGLTIYELTRQAFHPGLVTALVEPSLLELGIVTNVFLLLSFAYFIAGGLFYRVVLTNGAIVLWAIALFRISYFNLILHNPVWTHHAIDVPSALNALVSCALMFSGARLLRRAKEDIFVKSLEIAATVLLTVTIYWFTRQAFHPGQVLAAAHQSVLERGVVTNVFFLTACAYHIAGRHFRCIVLTQAAAVLWALALVRVVYFDLVLFNPLWTRQFVGLIPVVNHVIACALIGAGAGALGRTAKASPLAAAMDGIALTLLTVSLYHVTIQLFHPGQITALVQSSFFERGVMTNLFFCIGFACLLAGRQLQRPAFVYGVVTLWSIALARIAGLDLVLQNPILSHQFVGNLPVVNALLLPFALPILWTMLVAKLARASGCGEIALALHLFALGLIFVLVTFNVRQVFWGGYLDTYSFADSEFYAYSAAWLLTGTGLLIAGTIREDRTTRVASLVVILIAVGKVFVLDASVLQGLYRIASFFGLGVVLIALSWFYSRFVFVTARPAGAIPAGHSSSVH